jgi:hypothetical protein
MNISMAKRSSIIEESIGKEFGKLTVVRFIEFRKTPKSAKVPMVECRCECGRLKVASLWDIRTGKTKTCSFNHPHYEDRSLPAFNSLYNNVYKHRAIDKGLEFSLTKEEFKILIQQTCHYCGSPPRGNMLRKTGNRISQLIYNGLDRKDSGNGYTIENVVPCCGICNHAKHTMPYAEFIGWLDMLTAFRRPSLD